MTERFLNILGGRLFAIPLERFGDEFLRIKTNRKHQGKHNSTKENAEGEINNARSDFEMFQSHGHRQNEYKQLLSHTQHARILQIQVDGANQYASLQEAGNDAADKQHQKGADDIGDIGEDAQNE